MAKDPAFLFYPGDASEDTQFMNRLERGCYFDLLKAQKKFGKFTLDQIKKVLGKDFESCWAALELVLIKKGSYYFIEWVDEAIEKRRAHSEKQKENISKRWNTVGNTKDIPNDEVGKGLEIPLENGIENTNEIKDENENASFGKSENLFVLPKMFELFKKHNPKYPGNKDLDYKPLLKIHDFLAQQGNSPPGDEILGAWDSIAQVIAQDNFYKQKSLSTISNHIQEITQIALHGKQSTSKNGKQKLDEGKLKQKLTERYGNRQQT